MQHQPLPDWLINPLLDADWTDLSDTCNWAAGLFAKYDFSLEIYAIPAKDFPFERYRLFVTTDGSTYVAGKQAWLGVDIAGLAEELLNDLTKENEY
ncbi:hypothetical protein GCM10028807_54670 [Spirosoma daeguense]